MTNNASVRSRLETIFLSLRRESASSKRWERSEILANPIIFAAPLSVWASRRRSVSSRWSPGFFSR